MPEEEQPQVEISTSLGKQKRNWKKVALILLIALLVASLVGIGIYVLIPKLIGEPATQSQPKKESTPSATEEKTSPKYEAGLYFARGNSIYRANYDGENQKLMLKNAAEKGFFVYNLAFSASKKYLTWTSWSSKTHQLNVDFSQIFYYSNVKGDKKSIDYKQACHAIGYDVSTPRDFVYLWKTSQSTDKRNYSVQGSLVKLNLSNGAVGTWVESELIGPYFHVSPDASKILSIPCLAGGGSPKAKVFDKATNQKFDLDISYYAFDTSVWIDNNSIFAIDRTRNWKIVPADGSSGQYIPIDTSYEQSVTPYAFQYTKNYLSADRKNVLIITHLYGKVTKGGNVYKYDLSNKELVKLASLKDFEEQISSYGWLPNGEIWVTTFGSDPNKFYDLWVLSTDGKREKILGEITAHTFN
jgi:hypothetical protein